jgi:hypothetical protein
LLFLQVCSDQQEEGSTAILTATMWGTRFEAVVEDLRRWRRQLGGWASAVQCPQLGSCPSASCASAAGRQRGGLAVDSSASATRRPCRRQLCVSNVAALPSAAVVWVRRRGNAAAAGLSRDPYFGRDQGKFEFFFLSSLMKRMCKCGAGFKNLLSWAQHWSAVPWSVWSGVLDGHDQIYPDKFVSL